MAKFVTDEIIQQMGRTPDLERILNAVGLTPLQVMQLMQRPRGKEMIQAMRQLSRLHSEIVAHRHASFAVQKLCALLKLEKPEMWLKAATAVLAVGRVSRPGKRRAEKSRKNEVMKLSPDVAERLIRGLSVVLAREKGRK